jgi:hypothetical protein
MFYDRRFTLEPVYTTWKTYKNTTRRYSTWIRILLMMEKEPLNLVSFCLASHEKKI